MVFLCFLFCHRYFNNRSRESSSLSKNQSGGYERFSDTTTKKFLKYTGICSFVLSFLSFILILSCDSLVYSSRQSGVSISVSISGAIGIFGGNYEVIGVSVPCNATWSAVTAFVFILVAMIILLAGFILPLLKIHALDKVAGILNFVAVIALLVAGIFLFIELPCFASANGGGDYSGWSLGAGWIVAGILCLLAGLLSVLPAIFDFLGKK